MLLSKIPKIPHINLRKIQEIYYSDENFFIYHYFLLNHHPKQTIMIELSCMKNFLKNLILPEEDDDNNKDYRKYTYEELKEDNISYYPLYASLLFSLFEIYFFFRFGDLLFRMLFLSMFIYDFIRMINTSISNEVIEQKKFVIQKCIAYEGSFESIIETDEGYLAFYDEERPVEDGQLCWIIRNPKRKRAYIALPLYIEFDDILKSRII